MRVEQADAVGPEQTHPARARELEQFMLLAAPRLAGLGETVAEDGDNRDPLLAALRDGIGDAIGRHHDESMIYGLRHCAHVGIGFFAEDLLAAGIDRDDAPGKPVVAQEALRPRGVLRGVAGGADQRYRTRRKQCLSE